MFALIELSYGRLATSHEDTIKITSLKQLEELEKLKFICSMAGRWNESTGGGWNYKSEYDSDYITDEEVYDLIKNLANEDLVKFSGLDQIKLASFVLNYERRGPYSRVSEQEALKYVQKVKNEESCN